MSGEASGLTPPTGVARRLFALQLGAERVDRSLSVATAGPGRYWEPFQAVLVDTDAGWVVLDTGMSRAAFESPGIATTYGAGPDGVVADDGPDAAASAWHLAPTPPDRPGWAWILPGDPLTTALADFALQPADLALAAISHLHVDHSGGVPTLAAAGVPVVIGEAELDLARSGAVGEAEGFHPPDWSAPGTEWRTIASDTEIAPGVVALSTPGHTPGHLSFLVRLADTGDWVFCADAADLGQNLLDAAPCGSVTPDTIEARAAAARSTERLLSLGRAGARLIPGHDQVVLTAIRHPSGGHR